MGFRFRRAVKLFPGVRLNLSKSGVSTSVGVRGAHVTLGHGQVRETVGLPGTGLSYTETHSTHVAASARSEPPGVLATAWNLFFLGVICAVVFALAYACTSIAG